MRSGVGGSSREGLMRGKCQPAKSDGLAQACIPSCLHSLESAGLRSLHTFVTLSQARHQGLTLSCCSPNSCQSLAVSAVKECLDGLLLLKLAR